MNNETQKLHDRIAELESIVNTLPLTVDGYRVTPGMELFIIYDGRVESLGPCDPAENNSATDSEYVEIYDTHLTVYALETNAKSALEKLKSENESP